MYVANSNRFPLQKRNKRTAKRGSGNGRPSTHPEAGSDDRNDKIGHTNCCQRLRARGHWVSPGVTCRTTIHSLFIPHPPLRPPPPSPPLRNRCCNGSKPSHSHLCSRPSRQRTTPLAIGVNEYSRSAARFSRFQDGDVFVQKEIVRHRIGRVWRERASVFTHPISSNSVVC